jgi:hypothetical protein
LKNFRVIRDRRSQRFAAPDRLKSCVYFARDFWSPWAMGMDSGQSGGPGGGVIAQFHAVLRGNCVVTHDGQDLARSAGDVFLFAAGGAHQIADAPDRRAVPGATFMESLAIDAPLFSDGDAPTWLLCGHYLSTATTSAIR